MKASIGKKIAVFCLSAAMCVGIGFGLSGIRTAQAQTAEKDIVLDSYKLDSTVTVSDDASATGVVFPKTVQISNEEIATAYVITYPNGVSLSVKDGIVLDQVGLYTVTYKSVVGGVSNVYYDTFKVYNNFVDDGSTVELYEKDVYSAYTKLAVKGPYGQWDPDAPTADATVVETVKGVKVGLSAGSSVTFNQVIDTNNVRSDGFCEIATFNPNAADRVDKSLRAQYFDFTLTDVNDPDKYMKVTLSCSVASIGFSFGVETNCNQLIGTRDSYVDSVTELAGKRRVFYVDGVKNVAYLDSTATWGNGEQALYDYTILYNPETKVVKYECIRRFDFERNQRNTTSSDIIIDLDNPDIFDEGATLFDGFSTGEVKLTVQARSFTTSSVDCEFYAIGDVEYEDLQAAYIADAIGDTSAPEIKINVQETDANGVYTVYNAQNPVKFKIPSAIAYDASACSEVSARVYKNYTDESRVYVKTNADGTFDVSEKVIYTVEYKATDAFGNVGVATLRVVPVDLAELVAGDVTINEGIQVVFDEIELSTGATCTADVLKYFNTFNLQSSLKAKVTVTNGSETLFSGNYTYSDFAGDNVPTFNFKPMAAGDYTVTYEFSDNVEQFTYSYVATCVSSGLVDFAEAPLLQRYYILGMTYEKPDYTAYKFGNTITEAATDFYVSYDEGATWTEVEQTFVMGADADGNYISGVSTVKFKYASEGVEDYITASAPIVDVRSDDAIASGDIVRVKQQKISGVTYAGNLDQVKYFKGENLTVSKSSTNTVIATANVNSGSAKVSFINPVSIDSTGLFYLDFSTDETKADYNEITIRLVDAYDSTNVGSVRYFIANGGTRVSINGSKDVASSIVMHGSTYQMNFSLTNHNVIVGKEKLDFQFNPKNNLFYVEIELGNISGDNAQITVTTIGNHKFQLARTIDSSAPMIYYDSAAGSYTLNSEVVIKQAYINDILTPYVNTLADGTNKTKLTVMKGKTYAVSVDGVVLNGTQDPRRDYTIKLDEYATWEVKYSVEDAAGKSQAPNYQISATDKTAPTITLNYGFNEDTIHNVTLGKTFSIEYSVTDDLSESTKIKTSVIIINDDNFFTVYSSKPFEVIDKGGEYQTITDSCIITRKGMYTVYIMAIDEAGNISYANYKLNVQ